MGIDREFGLAYAKAYIAAGHRLPIRGTAFISVKNADKRAITLLAGRLRDLGFDIVATAGTERVLQRCGIPAREIGRASSPEPNIMTAVENGEVDLIITTPSGSETAEDQSRLRMAAIQYEVTMVGTLSGAMACVSAIEALRIGAPRLSAIQDYHASLQGLTASPPIPAPTAQYAVI